jgi:prolyl-tRNA editing enzyme YbaK/EbsC (Cys-tRNA(Pro) deacylase)
VRLDVNKKVRQLLGGPKLSFASAEQTAAVTGQLIGGVTAFALPPQLPLYVYAGLMTLDYVILGAGSRSAKIKIAPRIFQRLPQAEIVAGLAREQD